VKNRIKLSDYWDKKQDEKPKKVQDIISEFAAIKDFTVKMMAHILEPINLPPDQRLEEFKKRLEPLREQLEAHGRTVEGLAEQINAASVRWDEVMKERTGKTAWQHIADFDGDGAEIAKTAFAESVANVMGKVFKEEEDRKPAMVSIEVKGDAPPALRQALMKAIDNAIKEATSSPGKSWTGKQLHELLNPDQLREMRKILRQEKPMEERTKELRAMLKTVTLPDGLDADFLGHALSHLWQEGEQL